MSTRVCSVPAASGSSNGLWARSNWACGPGRASTAPCARRRPASLSGVSPSPPRSARRTAGCKRAAASASCSASTSRPSARCSSTAPRTRMVKHREAIEAHLFDRAMGRSTGAADGDPLRPDQHLLRARGERAAAGVSAGTPREAQRLSAADPGLMLDASGFVLDPRSSPATSANSARPTCSRRWRRHPAPSWSWTAASPPSNVQWLREHDYRYLPSAANRTVSSTPRPPYAPNPVQPDRAPAQGGLDHPDEVRLYCYGPRRGPRRNRSRAATRLRP